MVRANRPLRFIAGFIFAIAIMEALIRIFDPFDTLEFIADGELLWRYLPNQVGKVAEYGELKDAPEATINSDGFRGKEIAPRELRPRLVSLGDSATFGAL